MIAEEVLLHQNVFGVIIQLVAGALGLLEHDFPKFLHSIHHEQLVGQQQILVSLQQIPQHFFSLAKSFLNRWVRLLGCFGRRRRKINLQNLLYGFQISRD